MNDALFGTETHLEPGFWNARSIYSCVFQHFELGLRVFLLLSDNIRQTALSALLVDGSQADD